MGLSCASWAPELIKELERREAEAKVVPDASLDAFMKVGPVHQNRSTKMGARSARGPCVLVRKRRALG